MLIRRVCFQLTGLPPDPEEIDEFIRDESPEAYERMLDRYLASPQYGVRWARWWLDLARYGESNGFEFDEFRRSAWRYRDWVIDALNRDRPYDEFARLQIAGDALRPTDADAIAATGFLVAGAYDFVGQTQQSQLMRAVVRSDEIEDLVGTVGQTFLGVTVNCARCHDHKFDPIRQSGILRHRLGAIRSSPRRARSVRRSIPARSPCGSASQSFSRESPRSKSPFAKSCLRSAQRLARPPPDPVAAWNFETRTGGFEGIADAHARGRGQADARRPEIRRQECTCHLDSIQSACSEARRSKPGYGSTTSRSAAAGR